MLSRVQREIVWEVPVEEAAPDAILLDAARRDRRAFAPLYNRYLDQIYGYCLRRLGDRESAEDATSQIFTQALAALPGCNVQSFRPWLFAIAHNEVVDRHRSRRRDQPLDVALHLAGNEPPPEEMALASDQSRRLELAILQLPEDQRTVVELRLAGLSGGEIAAALGRSPGSTRVLQSRAVARLREWMTKPATSAQDRD
jgi:RNA polymerase sigma-70 factor (ECF subfamily)